MDNSGGSGWFATYSLSSTCTPIAAKNVTTSTTATPIFLAWLIPLVVVSIVILLVLFVLVIRRKLKNEVWSSSQKLSFDAIFQKLTRNDVELPPITNNHTTKRSTGLTTNLPRSIVSIPFHGDENFQHEPPPPYLSTSGEKFAIKNALMIIRNLASTGKITEEEKRRYVALTTNPKSDKGKEGILALLEVFQNEGSDELVALLRDSFPSEVIPVYTTTSDD